MNLTVNNQYVSEPLSKPKKERPSTIADSPFLYLINLNDTLLLNYTQTILQSYA
jgi:hypothetical protein